MHFYEMKTVLTAILLTSCLCVHAQLSKSQLKMTNTYFEVIANHPRYVRLLNQEIAELMLESNNLRASLQLSDSVRISSLIYSIDAFEEFTFLPDSVNIRVNRINDYIQTYYEIIPNGFGVYQAIKGTTESIGGVFGVGGLIGAILPNREPGLSSKKKKKLRNHLISSEEAFLADLKFLRVYIEQGFLPVLVQIEHAASSDFRVLMESIEERTAPLDYYTKHNRLVTRFYQKMVLAKSLTRQLIQLMNTIEQAERELISRVQEKQKVDLVDTHFNQLVVDVSRINANLQNLQEVRFR